MGQHMDINSNKGCTRANPQQMELSMLPLLYEDSMRYNIIHKEIQ